MTKDQSAQDPIKLELGATAEPRTCGSCYKFERRESWNGYPGGFCLMQLPPQYAKQPFNPEGKPPDRVSDNWSCDLYKHSGKTYIVSTLVKPS